jgi:PhnB protein
MSTVKPIPEGFNTITPHLVVRNAGEAIEFYKKAFGAEEIVRMPGPNGEGVMHCELKFGNSILMLNDEFPDMGSLSPLSVGGTSVTLHMYVDDADATAAKAIEAGATVVMPVTDMFWGDRYGMVTDPYGHRWAVATHKVDLTPAEMAEAGKKAMAEMHCGEPGK